ADGAPLGPRAVGRGPPSRPVLARPGVGYTWGVAPRGRPTAPGAGAPIDRRPHDGAGSRLREPLRHPRPRAPRRPLDEDLRGRGARRVRVQELPRRLRARRLPDVEALPA